MRALTTSGGEVCRPMPLPTEKKYYGDEDLADYPSEAWGELEVPSQTGNANDEVKLSRRIRIPDWLYEETADRLIEAIGPRDYFSGCVDIEAGRVECRMETSVIVYRETTSMPDGDEDRIRKLVPVWWEFHTEKDGEELSNDFNFENITRYI